LTWLLFVLSAGGDHCGAQSGITLTNALLPRLPFDRISYGSQYWIEKPRNTARIAPRRVAYTSFLWVSLAETVTATRSPAWNPYPRTTTGDDDASTTWGFRVAAAAVGSKTKKSKRARARLTSETFPLDLRR
jgi:hypothetical protein